MLPIRKPEVRIEFGGERPEQSGDHVATAIDEFDHQRVLDSEGFRFRLIGTAQWRAGDHPTPSVIETVSEAMSSALNEGLPGKV